MGALEPRALAVALALATATPWSTAAPHAPTPIPWAHPGQTATYRSCGCADACWTATVRERRTQRTVAVLRCDCEQMFSSVGRAPERPHPARCEAFQHDDKFERIRIELEGLVDGR